VEIDGITITLSNSLFVVADIVNSGGDFPIQRASSVEEDEKQ
jgi:hypothetical protein